MSVEDLQQGDELVSLGSGKTLRVKSLVLEAPQGTTHNLTVDKGHTFFVGNLGTWVHNVGPFNTCPGGVCGGDASNTVSVGRRSWTESEGVDLIASRPSILSDPSLSASDLAYLTRQFARKEASIKNAAARGELVFSPGTKDFRLKSL